MFCVNSCMVFAWPCVVPIHSWFIVLMSVTLLSLTLPTNCSHNLAIMSLIVSPVHTSTQLRSGPCQTTQFEDVLSQPFVAFELLGIINVYFFVVVSIYVYIIIYRFFMIQPSYSFCLLSCC